MIEFSFLIYYYYCFAIDYAIKSSFVYSSISTPNMSMCLDKVKIVVINFNILHGLCPCDTFL